MQTTGTNMARRLLWLILTTACLHGTNIYAAETIDQDFYQPSIHDGEVYWNYGKPDVRPSHSMFEIGRRFFFDDIDNREPKSVLPVINMDPAQFKHPPPSDIRITWMGHSTLLIEMGPYRLLTDPVFSERTSPVQWIGPKRFHPPPIAIKDLPELDAIIISHDHYDHLDYDSITELAPKTGKFFTPIGVGQRLIDWGIEPDKVIELDWWQEAQLNTEIKLAATPAQHFSGRTLLDRNETLWASWAIIGDKHRIYFSGDTGMFDLFKAIGDRYGPFDFTLMHVGAYADEWAKVHMNPEEAVEAHKMLRGKVFLPIHWGTFRLAFHPWKEPAERLYVKSIAEQLAFYIPKAGEYVSSPLLPEQTTWWRDIE